MGLRRRRLRGWRLVPVLHVELEAERDLEHLRDAHRQSCGLQAGRQLVLQRVVVRTTGRVHEVDLGPVPVTTELGIDVLGGGVGVAVHVVELVGLDDPNVGQAIVMQLVHLARVAILDVEGGRASVDPKHVVLLPVARSESICTQANPAHKYHLGCLASG